MEFGRIKMGLIGAGGFAAFAARAFARVPGVELAGVTDINPDACWAMSQEFGIRVYNDYDQMIASGSIDLIYIATPPFVHFAQSKQALLAGKHVICEKPPALQTSEAEELVQIARTRGLLYTVNLMQRYNPLFSIVKTIIAKKILGSFLHGFFENYASDEKLGPAHWFWDETKSGGIFIEHGVHFFDLFAGWLGSGKLLGAWQLQRPGIEQKIIDRVQATVLYPGGIVNFYHGFDQPGMLDRQEMRLEFECGEISLYEWVPVKIKLYGILEEGQLNTLRDTLPATATLRRYNENKEHQKIKGRFRDIVATDHFRMDYENSLGKQELYQEMLISMLLDQLTWIRSRDHQRVIDGDNAVQSLRMAVQADRMANDFNY
jgi:predicted dehydrogenase